MKKTKRILSFFLSFFLLPLPVHAVVKAPEKTCHSYVVMDAGSGNVLFGQDENKKIYPASTAKLMTAIVCVENGDVNSVIKTKGKIVHHTTPGTYNIGIGAKVKYTFKELLEMCLMSSSADATDSLAAGVFGSKEACVKAMNKKCGELGLTSTSFDNPVGSDIGAGFKKTYSTASEMAKICRYAMSIPLIRATVAKTHGKANGGNIEFNTTNWFLNGLAGYDKKTYRVIGSKSGTTNAAGHVFIATAMDGEGHEVICAYFGNVSKESTFISIRSLFDYTFRKYKKGKLLLSGSNYDVRGDRKYQKAYEAFASLNCYPSEQDGKFYPNLPISRSQLGTMIGKAGGLSDRGDLRRFVEANRNGKVTVRRFALLLQDLYPVYYTGRKERKLLSGSLGMTNAGRDEKEAMAGFLTGGFAVDDSCKNADHYVTRGQALLMTDVLADYQMRYAASHARITGRKMVAVYKLPMPVILFNQKWTNYLMAQRAGMQTE